MTKSKTQKLVAAALLCAMAYTVMAILRIPVLFLTIDFKDVIILIGGFLYGPLVALSVAVIVPLLEMFTVSDTELFGCAANALSSGTFVFAASFIYSRRKTLEGAIIGLTVGVIVMTFIMTLWNYIAVPFYRGIPREAVVGMLIPIFIPFNLFKGGINAILTMIIFKPAAMALHKAGLVELPIVGTRSTRIKWIFIIAGIAIVAAILFWLLQSS
ncbi:MAG: ECF transporter S component [Oscillospiraceae bacterium]|nr:ECF transporter S component [Oscillospiraceae bacterium]